MFRSDRDGPRRQNEIQNIDVRDHIGFIGGIGWRREFCAEPVGAAEWTIGRHFSIGERFLATQTYAGERFDVHAKVGIGESFVGDQGGDNCAGNFGWMPIGGGETGGRDEFGRRSIRTGGLHLPGALKRDGGGRFGNRRDREESGQQD